MAQKSNLDDRIAAKVRADNALHPRPAPQPSLGMPAHDVARGVKPPGKPTTISHDRLKSGREVVVKHGVHVEDAHTKQRVEANIAAAAARRT